MRSVTLFSLVSIGVALASWASQLPFTATPNTNTIISMASLPRDGQFCPLYSKHHPDRRVRIKAHDGWCDPSVRSYTGYIDTGFGKELFFYFFESRSLPEEDPVVMWINGGPGGSSAMGLFMEQGPCRIKKDPQSVNDTYFNPYSWNQKANVFFLDQPIGVGFSHGDNGQTVSTTQVAAKDVAAFIDIFFDTFKEYQGREFHMTGESYGGRYLPIFASEVYDQNTQLVKEGRTPINLKSVMIGNGGTSVFKLIESSYEFMCTKHIDLGRAVLDIKDCVIMAEKVPLCRRKLQETCLDSSDYTSCAMWRDYCNAMWAGTAALAGVNWYNVNETCSPEQRAANGCLEATQHVQAYLNLDSTRATLGVDPHLKHYEITSYLVYQAFTANLDLQHQTYYYVANLLERGIKCLIYVGTLDAACDHIGQSKWTAQMEWTGQQGFLAAPMDEWWVDGDMAGSVKTYGDLTLLKVFGAGHLVPTDRPKEALAMFNEWIDAVDG